MMIYFDTPTLISCHSVVTKEGEELGMKRNKVHLYDSIVIPLPMDQLRTVNR